MSKRLLFIVGALVALFVVACTPEPEIIEVTSVVTEVQEVVVTEVVTEVVEGEEVQVEVTKVVEVQVTPTAEPAPQGGTVINSTFSDISTLNPILGSDSTSSNVYAKMFLALLTIDPFTGANAPQIADSWDVSEDGLTYTFNLRDDISWSDGTPLTANDVIFTWDAINTDEVESPRRSNFSTVESWTAVDDYTIEVQLKSLDCTTVANLGTSVLTAHVYDNDPLNIVDSPENTAPTVVSGPFAFGEHQPDSFVSLVPNETYYLGAPNVDGWTVRQFADQSAEIAAVLAGEIDYTGIGAQFVSTIEGAIAAGDPFSTFKFFDDGYTYVGFNLANPENPQNGWDDLDGDGLYTDGEPALPQDPHPVLSDKSVRQAIAMSINYTDIINKVAFGQGGPMNANVVPAVGWAYNTDLTPYTQDLEGAAALLDEAGWVDDDGDGVRSKDGVDLAFTLTTNAGNEIRENIAVLMEETLEGNGFAVELDIIDFGTVVEKLLGQTYDAVIIGWTGVGADPDDRWAFSYQNDEVGAGFNFVSFYNEEFEANVNDGVAVAGCAEAERAPYYMRNQEIFHDEAIYAVFYVPLATVVFHDRLQGTDPGPWTVTWNMQDWYLTE